MLCYKLVQIMSVGCQSCKSWGFGAFCILCKKLTGIQYFANDKKWWRNVREIRPWSLFERFNSFSVHVLKLELEDMLMKFHVFFFDWTQKIHSWDKQQEHTKYCLFPSHDPEITHPWVRNWWDSWRRLIFISTIPPQAETSQPTPTVTVQYSQTLESSQETC